MGNTTNVIEQDEKENTLNFMLNVMGLINKKDRPIDFLFKAAKYWKKMLLYEKCK